MKPLQLLSIILLVGLALMGCAGVMMGVINVTRTLFAPLPKTQQQERAADSRAADSRAADSRAADGHTATQTQTPAANNSHREDLVVLILILVLIGATLALGVFPGAVSQIALQMAEGFTFF